MKCPTCGTENPPGKIVCRNCGRRLRAQAGPVATQLSEAELVARVRGDALRIVYVAAIVVAVALILGYVIR